MIMTKSIKSLALKALIFLLMLTLLCGVVYPLVVTGVSQLFFPKQANGSLIEVNGKKYGSELLAQQFTGNQYMWGRVMKLDVSTFKDANGKTLMYAAPSNLTPASDDYKKLIAERVQKIRAANPDQGNTPIPEDLVTCSASGLDPQISPAAAQYQIGRIAKARGISTDKVNKIVLHYTNNKLLGIFGEDTVNVLEVNLALDGILK